MPEPREKREDYTDHEDDVTASEVAAYTYCAKAWHLERVLHAPADARGQELRTRGHDQHAEHGTQVTRLTRYGRWTRWVSVLLLVSAIALVLAAVVL